MSETYWFLCDGAEPPRLPGGRRVPRAAVTRLAVGGDVRLRLDTFAALQQTALDARCEDLLRLAAFAYAADLRTARGGADGLDYGEAWHRELHLVVPVADPDFWNRSALRAQLESTLGFLTDDRWHFHFAPRASAPGGRQGRITDGVVPDAGAEFGEVQLFSGGLDSLCGAVEECVESGRRVALVGHHAANTVRHRQGVVFDAVRALVPDPRRRPHFVPLRLSLAGVEAADATQRSRSFVFAAAGAVVARQAGLSRVLFAENGVTSLNLPVCLQVLGGRASRTTHPKVLADYGRLLTLVFESDFAVENRFQWSTKTEMLTRLRAAGRGGLAALTRSCVRVRYHEAGQPHCGLCSQCVDRRLSAIAAGLDDAQDPAAGYKSDVLTGARAGSDLTMVDRYVGAARDVLGWASAGELVEHYPAALDALGALPGTPEAAQGRVYGLLRRHAEGVRAVLDRVAGQSVARITRQDYPPDSLLGVAVGRRRAAAASAPEAPRPGESAVGCWVVDPRRLEARWGGRACPLGRSLEFKVMEVLAGRCGESVPRAQLVAAAWDGARASNNAVQRVVSSLRRELRASGLTEWEIVGSRQGHYRLRQVAAAA